MNYLSYYLNNKTFIVYKDYRIKKIIEQVIKSKSKNILDIGCGDGFILKELRSELSKSKLTGVDVYKTKIKGIEIKAADITKTLPFNDESFDCVIMGEVIEHLPDPDFMLSEIRRVLKRNGYLIISIPNLVSWVNRIMVLLGIQPFFTETSTEKNLGRFYNFLGQNEKVQGHLKIFIYKSLEEILLKEKFAIVKKQGVPFFFHFRSLLLIKYL